ncbi:MAG TPA: branched-chain amino acid ABC transporter permease [Mycobacteriales bacterium]|nr:branched-chain amino acid ABC transporter permease [Mycobacteriales bacterium]
MATDASQATDTSGPDTGGIGPAARSAANRSPLRALLPWVGAVLAVLACLALQTQLFSGQERTVTTIFMFVALAQAWNLIGGLAGYACFGQVVFFGLGGYTTAVLMSHAHWSFWLTLVASAVVAAVFGAVIGLPLLRLKGHYFAVATLGVAEGMREVVTNVPSLTGGGAGISVPVVGSQATTAYLGNDGFYVLFLLLAVGSVLLSNVVARSRFGFALRAINQDEDAAASMGVNTTRTKVLTLTLSGFVTGLIGASYAFQQVTIFPERLFDVDITVLMIIMVILGGSGTVLGPLLGAVGLQYVSEWLRQHYTNAHVFILGAVIIAAVVLLPQGAVTYARDAWRTREFSLLSNIRRYRL